MSTSPWLSRPGSLTAHAGVVPAQGGAGTITGAATLQGAAASFSWTRSPSGDVWAALSRGGIDEARVSGGTGVSGSVSLTPASSGSYTARLYAAASGGPPIAETAAFTVAAAQVAPTSIAASAGTVAHDALAGSTVATLSAPGNTAPVTWSIVGGTDAARFSVAGSAIEIAVSLTDVSPGDTLVVRVRATNAIGWTEADLSFIAYDASAELSLFSRRAIGRGASPGTVHTFGQPFAAGRVPVGVPLTVMRDNGTPMRTQYEPLTFWRAADGTATHVKYALMAVELPTLEVDQTETFAIVRGASHPSPGPTLDLAAALASRSATVTVVPIDALGADSGTPFSIDLAGDVPAYRRRSGPLVSETRRVASIPPASFGGQASGRLIVDWWVTKDGALFVDPWVGNIAFDFPDIVATSVKCRIEVVIDGAIALAKSGEVATLAGVCRNLVGRRAGAAADPDPVYLRPNLAELVACGLSGWFTEGYGVAAGWVSTRAARLLAPAWGDWTTNGTQTPIRSLIHAGPTGNDENLYGIPFGDASAAIIIGHDAQFATAWHYMIGQAEGLGAQGNFIWDAVTDRWLNNIDRPSFQTHGNRSYFKPAGPGTKSFLADGAHVPLVATMPAIMTGRHGLADNVLASISSGVMYNNIEDAAGIRYASSPGGGQIRGNAYSLVHTAAYAFVVPEGEDRVMPGLYEMIADKWFDYHLDRRATLNAIQGEAYGQWEHTDLNRHSFWQEVMVAAALALMARGGWEKAGTLLAWAQHFIVGIWLVDGVQGVPSAVYNSAFTSADTLDTWAEVGSYSQLDEWLITNPTKKIDGNYAREQRYGLAIQAAMDPTNTMVQAACAAHDAFVGGEPRVSYALTKAALQDNPRQALMRPPGYVAPDATGV